MAIKFYHAVNSKQKVCLIKPQEGSRIVIEADIRMYQNKAVMSHDSIETNLDHYEFSDWIKDVDDHLKGHCYGLKLDFKDDSCKTCCRFLQ